MKYKEIEIFEVINFPDKVNAIVEDNAHHFMNDLYILLEGNRSRFTLSEDAKKALQSLALDIEYRLNKIKLENQEKESNQMTATYKGHPYD